MPAVDRLGEIVSGVLEGPGPVRLLKGSCYTIPPLNCFGPDTEGPMHWCLRFSGSVGHIRVCTQTGNMPARQTPNIACTEETEQEATIITSEGLSRGETVMVWLEGAAAQGRVLRWRCELVRVAQRPESDEPESPEPTSDDDTSD